MTTPADNAVAAPCAASSKTPTVAPPAPPIPAPTPTATASSAISFSPLVIGPFLSSGSPAELDGNAVATKVIVPSHLLRGSCFAFPGNGSDQDGEPAARMRRTSAQKAKDRSARQAGGHRQCVRQGHAR